MLNLSTKRLDYHDYFEEFKSNFDIVVNSRHCLSDSQCGSIKFIIYTRSHLSHDARVLQIWDTSKAGTLLSLIENVKVCM